MGCILNVCERNPERNDKRNVMSSTNIKTTPVKHESDFNCEMKVSQRNEYSAPRRTTVVHTVARTAARYRVNLNSGNTTRVVQYSTECSVVESCSYSS
ncbi:hypothetical protein NPIL_268601 [Nephila pilipes]|uniref:Uncharacterized protein n=1 Tax=Nephila pilipes TaxID=299642 RepID=A0A8X6NJD3_NEPPI|nr:hypothetical protein NPIL_268601 [Nephila pilipes]